MAKIEPKIFDELKTALVSFGDKYFVGEELNRSKLADDLRNYDEANGQFHLFPEDRKPIFFKHIL